MSTYTTDIAGVLNELVETCKDGEQGFRNAAENVKSAEYKTLFNELAAQRLQFAGQLQTLVGRLGESPDQTGSVAGAIHRGWMNLKSAVTSGDEHAVLAECERGEDAALAEYRKVLENPELADNLRAVVQEQFVAVQASHDRVKDLRDRLTT